ncbi:MAG: IS110 family transposase [Acidobacteriota bacterium]
MEVLVEQGAGIDVHKDSVTVCVMTSEGRKVVKTLRVFTTFHDDLERMRDWLLEMEVTHAAMESTGEYWKPVYEVLEGSLELLVANAQHVKNVPGRKTDPKDAEWLARLLRHGLLQASFVPAAPIRDLRDLTRLRRKTIEMGARVENRAQKVLEASGIKLGSVVTDVFGATGHAILQQLSNHKTDPAKLAELAKGSLKKKKPQIVRALEGSFTKHDAALLKHQMILHEQLQQRRAAIESQLSTSVTPYTTLISRMDEMPGINRDAAIEILGEIGNDMSAWANHRRFAAWAGLCPGNHESAGKKKKIGIRKGNHFLKSILVQAATAAVKTDGTYYQAKFNRLNKRRGYKRAIVAIAHSMLIAIYHMIRDDKPYHELGASTFNQRSDESIKQSLVKQLERLGYAVAVEMRTT